MGALSILSVCGTTHEDSALPLLLGGVETAARSAGAQIRRLDLRSHALPMFDQGRETAAGAEGGGVLGAPDDPVEAARALARWADAFVIGTPEYHGSMSGVLKNWFDHHFDELSGKLFAIVASVGGNGGDMSIMAVKDCVQWCHGFVLPMHTAARQGPLQTSGLDTAVAERLTRMGHDLVRYGTPLRAAYLAAQRDPLLAPRDPARGLAGLHALFSAEGD